MLQPFGEELWLADGLTTAVLGFRYPTRMAVVRLTGGPIENEGQAFISRTFRWLLA